MPWPRRGAVLQHRFANRRGRRSSCLLDLLSIFGTVALATSGWWHYPVGPSRHHKLVKLGERRAVYEGEPTSPTSRSDLLLATASAKRVREEPGGSRMPGRRSSDRLLRGRPRAVLAAGTVVRATRLLMAHEAEAAARNQRECLRIVWRLAHQLTRTSDTAPSAHGHVSPPRSGRGRNRIESAS
jgi:hypothetical protein